MDALAGYGSDDSSSASEKHPQQLPLSSSNNNPLSGLLGSAASDDDDSSIENNDSKNLQSNLSKASTSTTTMTTMQPALKRPRLETTTNKIIIPAPDVSAASLVLWDTDYLSKRIQNQHHTQQQQQEKNALSEKLDNLSKSLKDISWADHLKALHEFHNPHFFESVVEHFGISEPLGSQIYHPIIHRPYEATLFPSTRSSTSTITSSVATATAMPQNGSIGTENIVI